MAGTASSGGRNKKSATAHARDGTGRKDRGTDRPSADAPDPPAGRPPIPIGLIGPALEEWSRMVVRLEAAKTLSTVDDAALYQYCLLFAETEAIGVAHRTTTALVVTLQVAIARWTQIVERLDDDDDRVATIGAQIVEAFDKIVQLKKLEEKYPTKLRQGHMALRQMLVEFGMTPAARSRVQPAADAPVASAIDRFTKPRP